MARTIYLHGFASGPSSKKARFFLERLPSLTIPDLTEGDFEHLTITGQLTVLEREAAGEPVVLIGSSLGGYLAALYAARHPEVERVVLLAPAFCFPSLFPRNIGPQAMDQWKRAGKLSIFNYAKGANADLGYQLIEDSRQYEDFPAFPQPALIFHGVHDASVPVSYSERFAAEHPNATLRLMDSDHELISVLPQLREEALAFLRI